MQLPGHKCKRGSDSYMYVLYHCKPNRPLPHSGDVAIRAPHIYPNTDSANMGQLFLRPVNCARALSEQSPRLVGRMKRLAVGQGHVLRNLNSRRSNQHPHSVSASPRLGDRPLRRVSASQA